jgi:hypothetical protein
VKSGIEIGRCCLPVDVADVEDFSVDSRDGRSVATKLNINGSPSCLSMSADVVASRKTRRRLTEVAAHGEVRDHGNEVDQGGDVVEDAVARVSDVAPNENSESSNAKGSREREVDIASMGSDMFVDGLTIGGKAVRGESIVASCSQSYEHHEGEEFGQHDGLVDGSVADVCIELLQL